MTPDRWKRIEAIFNDALARRPADRAAFLAEACGGDDTLRQEVAALLDESVSDAGILGRAGVALTQTAAVHAPMTGRTIGPYRLDRLIGAGGMGEVYSARDTTLGREVAIKILPRALTRDPDRLARFEREARMLAALNHPNICAIYGVEESDGLRLLILEFVDGENLYHKLERLKAQGLRAKDSGLKIGEALAIAKQIVDALDAAHEKGIVHRDLKPANITITRDGVVKVLDFGLAKPVGDRAGVDITQSPTITQGGSHEGGVILGTAAYMSPEQARGKNVDKRADIWAFGCVLYEMLTGRMAFGGETVSDTIGKILEREPDWTALPADTPPAVRQLLVRCLVKDAKQRLRDIGDVRLELDVAAGAAPSALPRTTGSQWLPWAVAAALAVALTAGVAWSLRKPAPASTDITRFTIVPPEAPPFAGTAQMLSLSPDGTEIMYTSTNRIFRRPMSTLAVTAFTSAETLDVLNDPVFSPDGRSIAFYAHGDRTLRRMPIAGGASTLLGHMDPPFGASWGKDGIVVGQGRKGILRVSPGGGAAETIVRMKDGELAHGPQILPNGSHVLFTLATGGSRDRWDQAQIVVESLKTGERKTLLAGGSDARYVTTGHILYAVSGVLYAIAFDPDRLEIKGDAVPVLQGISRSAGGATGTANFTVSSNGSLAYIPGPVSATLVRLALVDRRGAIEFLNVPPGSYLFPRASPDGTRLLFGTDDGKESVIFTRDFSAQGGMQRLTFGGHNRYGVWTSPNRRIAFQSDREGDLAIWQATDGSGTAERLTRPAPGESHEPESWSAATDTLLFNVRKGSDLTLWTYSFRTRTSAPFGGVRSTSGVGPNATFSPDGRWVAYSSNESGQTIAAQPFPATTAHYEMFPKGADDPHHPLWSSDGREIFYVARPGALESVAIATQPNFFGASQPVPSPGDRAKTDRGLFLLGPPASRRMFDLMPDGRFLGVMLGAGGQTGAGAAPHIEVVLNWFEELKALTARGSAAR